MDYESLSDFEINKLVAEALGYVVLPRSGYTPGFVDNHPNSVWTIQPNHQHAQFQDFCNSPTEAWPIIISNRIHIGWSYDDTWRAEITNQGQPGLFRKFEFWDESPLRACMVVYLMMQEATS